MAEQSPADLEGSTNSILSCLFSSPDVTVDGSLFFFLKKNCFRKISSKIQCDWTAINNNASLKKPCNVTTILLKIFYNCVIISMKIITSFNYNTRYYASWYTRQEWNSIVKNVLKIKFYNSYHKLISPIIRYTFTKIMEVSPFHSTLLLRSINESEKKTLLERNNSFLIKISIVKTIFWGFL